ncbi:MAG: hypothetical protein HYR76_11970 [Ignavibacteria bacterium]|nr:hypothetical protein [Ignavibacteria bacterium]MBI3765787.1 hypothetical protein [Ignavibacteriales bacterium]
MRFSSSTYKLLSLLIVCNYFAFRVELFENEYERFHPDHRNGSAFTNSSLNWETFDKDNAPKAFVFDPSVRVEFICVNDVQREHQLPHAQPSQLIRDKSPPLIFSQV